MPNILENIEALPPVTAIDVLPLAAPQLDRFRVVQGHAREQALAVAAQQVGGVVPGRREGGLDAAEWCVCQLSHHLAPPVSRTVPRVPPSPATPLIAARYRIPRPAGRSWIDERIGVTQPARGWWGTMDDR